MVEAHNHSQGSHSLLRHGVDQMIVTIVLGIFSILFAYLAKYKNTQWGLKVSFTLIFFFLALRYNFGNDYETYLKGFIGFSQSDLEGLYYYLLTNEPGWILLNWLFRSLGFFAMTAMLALISCAIYYRFITKYVSVRYYWLAIFLYIFHPVFMIINSSAMRQSIAIMIFVLSLDYLCKKDAIRYFLCIGFASLFHYTALTLLPVYLLVFLNRKIRLVYGSILISIYASLFLFGSSLTPYLKLVITTFSEKYDYYQDAGVVKSGLGFLYYSTLFVLVLYFERLQIKEVALVFKIAVVSFLIIPLALIVDMTGRLGIYFAPATIVVYPIIVMNLKKTISKTILSTILVAFTLFQFFQFFYSDDYKDYFGIYQTVFSAPQWY